MNLLHIGLAALAISLPHSARGQAAIFSFVDKCGVLHLSNVDEDRPVRAVLADSAVTCGAVPAKIAAKPPTEEGSGYHAIIAQAATRHGIAAHCCIRSSPSNPRSIPTPFPDEEPAA